MQQAAINSSSLPAAAVISVSFFVLGISFAARSVIGLGMSPWSAEFGWSRGAISGAGSLGLCVMAIVVPLSGYAADRWGAGRLLVLGCAALAIALAVLATMERYWQLAVGYGVFGGVGFALAALPVVGSLVLRQVHRKQGLATGIATAGTTAGQLLILPAMAAAFPVLGWRESFLAFAMLSCAVAIIAFVTIGREQPLAAKASTQPRDCLTARLAPILRKRAFHGLFLSFTLCGFTSTGVVETHLIPFAQSCGFPPFPSTIAYGAFAVFNLFGMLFAGHLSDRMDRRVLLVSIYLLRSLAFIVPLYVANEYSLLIMFSIFVGIAFYATFPPTVGLSAAHFGVSNLGLVMGLLTVGHALGAAGGAYLGGAIFDLLFRYEWTWAVSIALAASAGLFALLIPDPRGSGQGWTQEAVV